MCGVSLDPGVLVQSLVGMEHSNQNVQYYKMLSLEDRNVSVIVPKHRIATTYHAQVCAFRVIT